MPVEVYFIEPALLVVNGSHDYSFELLQVVDIKLEVDDLFIEVSYSLTQRDI